MFICGYKTVKKNHLTLDDIIYNSFNSKLNLGKTLVIELGRKCDARDRRLRNSSLTCAPIIRQLKKICTNLSTRIG